MSVEVIYVYLVFHHLLTCTNTYDIHLEFSSNSKAEALELLANHEKRLLQYYMQRDGLSCLHFQSHVVPVEK